MTAQGILPLNNRKDNSYAVPRVVAWLLSAMHCPTWCRKAKIPFYTTLADSLLRRELLNEPYTEADSILIEKAAFLTAKRGIFNPKTYYRASTLWLVAHGLTVTRIPDTMYTPPSATGVLATWSWLPGCYTIAPITKHYSYCCNDTAI